VVARWLWLWIPMIALGILNGALRELTYGRHVGELGAHQLSCLVGVLLFGVYAWLVPGRRPLERDGQALAVGLAWVALTVAFEFLFGRLVAGHSWERLVADYDLGAGRLWALVLVALGALPWLVSRLRRRAASPSRGGP
jgi:hypothetical protein